jgi:hypothetical protein
MIFETFPLLFSKFDALPISVPRIILWTELYSPWFARCTFGCCNMSLKLYGVGAGVGDSIDKRVSLAEAAVMRLSDLGNDETIAGIFERSF